MKSPQKKLKVKIINVREKEIKTGDNDLIDIKNHRSFKSGFHM